MYRGPKGTGARSPWPQGPDRPAGPAGFSAKGYSGPTLWRGRGTGRRATFGGDCLKGLDGISKQVLDALVADPRADGDVLAQRLGVQPDVVRSRIDRMRDSGVLRGFSVRLDSEALGVPHEMMVTAAPTDQTTRERLEALCAEPGVTRVWTLASRNSIAFTLRGADADRLQRRAADLAGTAGLADVTTTLVVDTLHDDPSLGVHGAWRNEL